jgi:hypothetical protein
MTQPALLTFDPNATIFWCNGKIWLQKVVFSQPFSLLVEIDEIVATKIVLWQKV